MEEKAREQELLPFELHDIELEETFDKLVKNRTVLCDEKGKIRKENSRYKAKYQELVNKVANLAATCIKDDVKRLYIPGNLLGEACGDDIKTLFFAMQGRFTDTIVRGTHEDFEKVRDEFWKKTVEIYLRYIANGMHAHLYANA